MIVERPRGARRAARPSTSARSSPPFSRAATSPRCATPRGLSDGGRVHVELPSRSANAGRASVRSSTFSPAHPRWFVNGVRRADAGAGAGLAGDRVRRARPDLRPDRLGQDAGRVPVGDRSARAASRGRDAQRRASASSTSRRSRRSPTTSTATCARRCAGSAPSCKVAVRTGDTPQRERQAMLREPPDILITTPESLYLMLTGRAQELFDGARWCIVDEIHAVAATKRGAHLALTLERLAQAAGRDVQRIGLSATQNPLEEVGRFMVGPHAHAAGSSTPACARSSTSRSTCRSSRWSSPMRRPRPDLDPLAGGRGDAALDLARDLPRAARADRGPPLDDHVRQHPPRRRAAGAAAQRAGRARRSPAPTTARSRARSGRVVEELLKAGELPCLVATSSLELGIDMGAVDLVIQVESPKSVARGLQRIGRAGHSVGDVSRGRIFPKFRADLLECAVVAQADARGRDRDRRRPAQRARRARPADRRDRGRRRATRSRSRSTTCTRWYAHALLRRAPRARSSRTCSTCSTAATPRPSSPSCARGSSGTGSRARSAPGPGARQLAVTNAGTIPDRGLYAVTLPDGRRVGELDEEMVYEARARARRSCSAPPPGGSRRSAATG